MAKKKAKGKKGGASKGPSRQSAWATQHAAILAQCSLQVVPSSAPGCHLWHGDSAGDVHGKGWVLGPLEPFDRDDFGLGPRDEVHGGIQK